MDNGMGHPVPWDPDPKKHSAAFKLFHYNFYGYVSGLHLTSAEELQVFGYVTTGNSAIDRQLAAEERLVYITTAAMVLIHAKGGGVRLQNPEDGAKIYQMIYQHLQDWRYEVESNPGRLRAPIDDLRAFDEFARELHPHARHYLAFNPANNSLLSALERMAAGRGNFQRAPNGMPLPEAPPDLKVVTHKSPLDTMTRMLRDRQSDFRN